MTKEMLQKYWKQLGIGLFSVAVLGGSLAYGIVQSNHSSETGEHQATKVKRAKKFLDGAAQDDQEENSQSKEFVLDRLDGATTKNTRGNLLEQARGSEYETLPNQLLKNTLADFDTGASQADHKAQLLKADNERTGKETVSPLNATDERLTKLPSDKKDEKNGATPVVSTETPTPAPRVTPPAPVVIVDYRQLTTLVVNGEQLSAEDYFTETYQRFSAELAIAKAICQDQSASQAIVDGETVRLQAVMGQLIHRGDKTRLSEMVSKAEQVPTDRYTTASVADLTQAIQQAKQVLETADVTQTQVNEQVNHLQLVITQLVKRGDKTVLNEALQHAKQLHAQEYTTASALVFNEAYKQADHVANDIDALQNDIDQVLAQLNAAEQQLVKRGDKTQLQALLTKVKAIDRELYTTDSLQVLDDAASDAEQVIQNIEALQTQIDTAKTTLQTAFDGLTKVSDDQLDRIYLQRLVNECLALKETDYTPASFNDLKVELEKAQQVLADTSNTGDVMKVKAELEALHQAEAQLQKRVDEDIS